MYHTAKDNKKKVVAGLLLAAVCTLLPTRAGFNFSAGLVDYILSFKAPMAQNPLIY